MERTTAGPAGLMPSLVDRLTDPDSEGTGWQRGYSTRQMLEAVRRDLEDLFNTHQSWVEPPAGFTEVTDSLLTYGLPDLASIARAAEDRGQTIRELIAAAVTRFEPRLRDVRVVLAGGDEAGDRRVRFQIEASLNVDPSPEVAFETILELSTGQASIRTGGS
jgi:type VI secretion system protein ImpF